jgi:ribosomal protein S18 acetylase RimI-like enzyme
MKIREMTIDDYDTMTALWRDAPGVRLVAADSRECIAAFLARNPGMSFVCANGEKIVGTAMCGHDGRRGYFYHVAVQPEYRGRHIGTRLVAACLMALGNAGIDKCHVFVLADNALGNAFWTNGWKSRGDISLYSREV